MRCIYFSAGARGLVDTIRKSGDVDRWRADWIRLHRRSRPDSTIDCLRLNTPFPITTDMISASRLQTSERALGRFEG